MDRRHRRIAAFALLAPLLAAGPLAIAQVARSGGGSNANTQLLEQMQQLASERTTLQAENEKLKGELADLKKERDALKAGQQSVTRRAQESSAALAHSNAERDSATRELEQTKAKMQELIAKFRETIQRLRDSETESAASRQTVAARDRELAVCRQHNAELYSLDDQVLTHLEKEGVFSRVARTEPFTRIKRNQLENYVDEQRENAQAQRLTPVAPTPAATPAPEPPPPAAPPAAPNAAATPPTPEH